MFIRLLDCQGVGSPKKPTTLVDDPGTKKEMANVNKSKVVTLKPFLSDVIEDSTDLIKSNILNVKPVPLSWSYDIIYDEFAKFGTVKEIRSRLGKDYQHFETWIVFSNVRDAYKALNGFNAENGNVNCSLVDEFPWNLDIYRPINHEDPELNIPLVRSPKPPRWIIISTCNERGNLFKVKKLINKKLVM